MTTKIHALVEGLGHLARWELTAGQRADITQAAGLLDGIRAQSVAADKAYDADALIGLIAQTGAEAVIAPRETACCNVLTMSTCTSIATSSSAGSVA